MRFERWIITRRPIDIIPTRWYRKGFRLKRVPVLLEELPVVVWLLLKDVVFDIQYAPYILSTYLDIHPARVTRMKAGRVIALFNHIRNQVEKCNRIYEWANEDLLQMSDGVDNSHFEGIETLSILHDLTGNGGVTMEQAEQLSFSQQMNYLKIRNAYIRSEQNRTLQQKQKLKK